MEKKFRVVCSTDTAKDKPNLIVDFDSAAIAEAQVTHQQLFMLRRDETPHAQQILPPIFLTDKDGDISLEFDKSEKSTAEDQVKLQELSTRIKLEYQKLKHRGQTTTIPLTNLNFACLYEGVDTSVSPENSQQEELFKRINASRAKRACLSSKRDTHTPSLQERLERY